MPRWSSNFWNSTRAAVHYAPAGRPDRANRPGTGSPLRSAVECPVRRARQLPVTQGLGMNYPSEFDGSLDSRQPVKLQQRIVGIALPQFLDQRLRAGGIADPSQCEAATIFTSRPGAKPKLPRPLASRCGVAELRFPQRCIHLPQGRRFLGIRADSQNLPLGGRIPGLGESSVVSLGVGLQLRASSLRLPVCRRSRPPAVPFWA